MKKLGATGILYNEGRILLGERDRDDAAWAGYLCTPGGGVEPGESVNAATIREFREETGLEVRVLDWCCVEESERTLLIFSQVTFGSPRLEAKPLDGFSSVTWFSWAEIWAEEERITPLTFAGLRRFKQYLNFYKHYPGDDV